MPACALCAAHRQLQHGCACISCSSKLQLPCSSSKQQAAALTVSAPPAPAVPPTVFVICQSYVSTRDGLPGVKAIAWLFTVTTALSSSTAVKNSGAAHRARVDSTSCCLVE